MEKEKKVRKSRQTKDRPTKVSKGKNKVGKLSREDRAERLLMKMERDRVRRESSMTPSKRRKYLESGEIGGLYGTIRDTKNLTGIEIVITMLLLFFANMGIYYFASKNILISIIVGIIGMFFFFIVFTVPNRKLEIYRKDLSEGFSYVMNMTFFITSGQNVLDSLRSVAPLLEGNMRKDVEKLIETTEKNTVLDTEHFHKYNYSTLNQFHHNLSIYYYKGGNAAEMLKPIQHNMAFELKKRDELYRKRKGMSVSIMTLLGLIGMIVVVLSTAVGFLWEIFLSYTVVSSVILMLTYLAVLGNLYLMQKHYKDISVRQS